MHKLLAGNGLLFQQIFGELMKLGLVGTENIQSFLMGGLHGGYNLLVNFGGGLGRTGQRAVAP